MDFAFLIDKPESLHIEKDTASCVALMLEAQRRGHRLHVLERGDMALDKGSWCCACGRRRRLPTMQQSLLKFQGQN
ncbi:MAG: hypothetical protein U1F27_17030 [Turneriella sp.]